MSKIEYIQECLNINRRFEGKYFPKIKTEIDTQIESVIGWLKNDGVHSAVNYARSIVFFPSKNIDAMHMEVGLRYARKQWRQFMAQKKTTRKSYASDFQVKVGSFGGFIEMDSKRFGFNEIWSRWIKNYLHQFLLEKITFKASAYTRDTILRVLQTSIDNGWGIDKTVEALKELPLSATQSARIVRTEVGRAANAGVLAASDTFEYEQSKEWISAHDNRVRGSDPNDQASHRLLNGTVIGVDDYFIDPINKDEMRAPGDPGEKGRDVSASSTVNCRCMIAVVAKVDRRGRLIPKNKNIIRP